MKDFKQTMISKKKTEMTPISTISLSQEMRKNNIYLFTDSLINNKEHTLLRTIEIKSILESKLQDELEKQILDYSKNNNTYITVKDLTGQAIENAKKLEQYQLNKGQVLDSEDCNPYTGVYKITEELINRNKEKL